MMNQDLQARLDVLAAREMFSDQTLARLGAYVQQAPDDALYRMSPLRYAAGAGLDEGEAVDLFIHAASAGILDFQWGVLCPGCVAFLTTPSALRSLQDTHTCALCKLNVGGHVDDNVEVAFTVSASIRTLRFHSLNTLDLRRDSARLFFSSSLPEHNVLARSLSENWVLGRSLRPNAYDQLELCLEPGLYVLLAPSSHGALKLNVRAQRPGEEGAWAGSPPADVADIEIVDGNFLYPDGRDLAPNTKLNLLNRTPRTVGILLFRMPDIPLGFPPEQQLMPQCTLQLNRSALLPYLTGKRLLTTQAFRDLFHAESIPSGSGLELRSLTVLFTDLKDSTALYERVGDVRAFDLVRAHFDILRAIVRSHGGGVVKTIGDAVMATFPEPSAGVRASIEMHRHVAAAPGGGLRLKIGLHAGPCIAVNLNERLDYFGRTVNVAARVQGLASGGETLLTREVYASEDVAGILDAEGVLTATEQVQLKGIDGHTEVMRTQPVHPPRV